MKRASSSLRGSSGSSSGVGAGNDAVTSTTGATAASPANQRATRSRYFSDEPPAKKPAHTCNCSQHGESDAATAGSEFRFDTSTHTSSGSNRLGKSFFDTDCESLAKKLLGCVLAHRVEGSEDVIRGRIVETEAYLGGDDKAAHSFQGKRTQRNEAMFMPPGTLYVYMLYGMHHCVNVSSRGEGAAVLLRSVEPADEGSEVVMRQSRAKSEEAAKKMKYKDIGAGPGRLGGAMQIRVGLSCMDTCQGTSAVWFEAAAASAESDVVTAKRVGVDYAGEWADKPLRFYLASSRCVSVRDKSAEAALRSST